MKDAELSPQDIEQCYGINDWALSGFTDYVLFAADQPA